MLLCKNRVGRNNSNLQNDACKSGTFKRRSGTSRPDSRIYHPSYWDKRSRAGLERQRFGLTAQLLAAPDVVSRRSGCCGHYNLVRRTRRVAKGRPVSDNDEAPKKNKKIKKRNWRNEQTKESMNTKFLGVSRRCYNKLIARGNKDDNENERVSFYRP